MSNSSVLHICEIFKSIQGESSYAGLPCSFVRLSGCNLRCTWCDTDYSWSEGTPRTFESIIDEVSGHQTRLVEITGGEPLLQKGCADICRRFQELNYTVLVETSGACDISVLPDGVIRIMDLKCPGSGMEQHNLYANIDHLTPRDEIKFVISDHADFLWAESMVVKYALSEKCPVIYAPNHSALHPKQLSEWILEHNSPVRLGMQLHKYIWGATVRGV